VHVHVCIFVYVSTRICICIQIKCRANALHWIKYTDTLLFLVCSNAGLENDKKHWMKECERLKQDLCQANREVEALQAHLDAVENTDEKVNILNNSVTYHAVVCHIIE